MASQYYKSVQNLEKRISEYLKDICDVLNKFRTLSKIEEESIEELLSAFLPLPKFNLTNELQQTRMFQIAKLCIFLVE